MPRRVDKRGHSQSATAQDNETEARAASAPESEAAAPPPAGPPPDANWRYIAWAVICIIYCAWFSLIIAGARTYEGERAPFKPQDLPLYHFDRMFRAIGSGVLLAMWGLRAFVSAALPGGGAAATVWVPGALYAAQAALRLGLYALHRAGVIFTPQRWGLPADLPPGHTPHIMSDHILLAASVVGGLACEAALPFLQVQGVRDAEASGPLRSCGKLATVLAVLVSWESYYTARFFHPPSEIVVAVVLGFVLFQAPMLYFTLRAIGTGSKAESQHMAAARRDA